MSQVTQRNATRNQSTADIRSTKKVFLFDNRFVPGIYKNTTGGALTIESGYLAVRSTTVVDGFESATVDNLADVIGVLMVDETVTLANNGTTPLNIGTKGNIDGGLLVLPATVTLNTVVGNKRLKDILETLGLHIDTGATEHTQTDN